MFSLLYGFWQYVSRRPEFNVLILGLDGAGKTTLLERVKHELSGGPMPPPEKVGHPPAPPPAPAPNPIFRSHPLRPLFKPRSLLSLLSPDPRHASLSASS